MITELASRRTLSNGRDGRRVEGERAGNMPLFVEEVTRLILERGKAARAAQTNSTDPAAVGGGAPRPADRRAKSLRSDAVLRRSFSYALLRDIQPALVGIGDPGSLTDVAYRGLDEASLKSALACLVDADLLFVDGVPPEVTYRFKHALIQDAACDGLPKPSSNYHHDRRGRGARAAQSEPEAIARHLTADPRRPRQLAIEWSRGGRQAKRLCAVRPSRRRSPHLGNGDRRSGRSGTRSSRTRRLQTPARSRRRLGGAHRHRWSRSDVVERFWRRRNERGLRPR